MTKKFLYAVLMATALFGLVNCAKEGGSGSKAATTPTCSAGSIYHASYGCLPTAQCTQYGANYGYYNGQCVAGDLSGQNCSAGSIYHTSYGCLPTTQCTQYGANYGYYNGQCVAGNYNNYQNYYGNQPYNPYQQQYYNYNPYYQYYNYNPYGYNNGGLYFYFGW